MTIAERIEAAVMGWEGVSASDHRFGGREFRVEHHEIGHLHGSRLADLPFPRKIGKRLVEEGRAQKHHYLPETGWVSYPIRGEQDVDSVIQLFRENDERIVTRRAGSTDG